ncbi:MAG: NAD(P)-dependent oxidoreductase [Deltaproteobacteria bacterium]|nr:NAD(P)-dependent oxidoreductase [Deltaproteobacteria bacterium]
MLITGAAGNLGGHLARSLLGAGMRLRLMVHRTPLDAEIAGAPGVEPVEADLAYTDSLRRACRGVDTVVHFAGKLFAPGPEKFLPRTNTLWAHNLIQAALDEGTARFVLVSFPHVEGPSDPEHPARGRLDAEPVSVHAQTRLAAEHLLFDACRHGDMQPVVLRSGMVYGRGVLMIDAGRRLLARRLLGVWRRPTWIHLISLTDFLAACRAAIERPALSGIFNLGDEQPTTLQAFADRAARHWGLARPWRAPRWAFFAAAWLVECFAKIFGTRAPLTVDFVRIGMVSYVMDTARTRSVLLPELRYPTLEQGIESM